MKKPSLLFVGGDKREAIAAALMAQQGYEVRTWGFELFSDLAVENMAEASQAAAWADVVLLPLAGVRENLQPNSPFAVHPPLVDQDFFRALKPGTTVFVGWARRELRDAAAGVNLVEVAEDDELAILNSIPTAEGAVAIAMDRAEITIHGHNSLVVGFGRCGLSLARMLAGIGACVWVLARKAADRARAWEMGFRPCTLRELPEIVAKQHFIFNTVPAPVLTREVLARAEGCQVIVDIASSPGGTDFAAARELGIAAILAPGLPGQIAPRTAGEILARVYPRLLAEHLERRE